MPIEYEYDDVKGVVNCLLSGEVSLADVENYINSLLKDEAIRAAYVEVVDFSEVENITLSFEDGIRMVQLFDRLKSEKQYIGSIAVAPTQYTFGMARMFQAEFEFKGIRAEIVNTMDEAVRKAEEIFSNA